VDDNKSGVTWAVSPNVRATIDADRRVLLDIRKGLCYNVNPVAARARSTVETSHSGIDPQGLVHVMEPSPQGETPLDRADSCAQPNGTAQIGMQHYDDRID
jgi:hypothetical protein